MCVMLMMTFWEGPRAFAKQHLPLLLAKAAQLVPGGKKALLAEGLKPRLRGWMLSCFGG